MIVTFGRSVGDNLSSSRLYPSIKSRCCDRFSGGCLRYASLVVSENAIAVLRISCERRTAHESVKDQSAYIKRVALESSHRTTDESTVWSSRGLARDQQGATYRKFSGDRARSIVAGNASTWVLGSCNFITFDQSETATSQRAQRSQAFSCQQRY